MKPIQFLFIFISLFGLSGHATPEFRVERATFSHDLQRIVQVINCAYRRQPFNRMDGERISLSKLNEIVINPNSTLFLLISGHPENLICGTILLQASEISLFSLHPNYQGKGLGRLLLYSAEEEAFKTYDEVFLKVIPLFQEKLIAHYEQLGYQSLGERESLTQEKLERIQPQYHNQVYALILRKKNSKFLVHPEIH